MFFVFSICLLFFSKLLGEYGEEGTAIFETCIRYTEYHVTRHLSVSSTLRIGWHSFFYSREPIPQVEY